MDKTILSDEIDFADSDFKSFKMREDGSVDILLVSWDARCIKITFYKTIQFIYKLNSGVRNLYQINEGTSFLDEALLQEYGRIPDKHPYKHFQIEDIDDFPFIQVVAEKVNVIKE